MRALMTDSMRVSLGPTVPGRQGLHGARQSGSVVRQAPSADRSARCTTATWVQSPARCASLGRGPCGSVTTPAADPRWCAIVARMAAPGRCRAASPAPTFPEDSSAAGSRTALTGHRHANAVPTTGRHAEHQRAEPLESARHWSRACPPIPMPRCPAIRVRAGRRRDRMPEWTAQRASAIRSRHAPAGVQPHRMETRRRRPCDPVIRRSPLASTSPAAPPAVQSARAAARLARRPCSAPPASGVPPQTACARPALWCPAQPRVARRRRAAWPPARRRGRARRSTR
jgi:hypothetical protein